MSVCKYLLIQAIILCLLLPAAVLAVEVDPEATEYEAPSFQNQAQVEHANNLTSAVVANSAGELADAADKEATPYAQIEATNYIDQKAQDYADGVMKDAAEIAAKELIDTKTKDYADGVMQDAAEAAAKELTDTKIQDYAEATALGKTDLAEPPIKGDDEYRE